MSKKSYRSKNWLDCSQKCDSRKKLFSLSVSYSLDVAFFFFFFFSFDFVMLLRYHQTTDKAFSNWQLHYQTLESKEKKKILFTRKYASIPYNRKVKETFFFAGNYIRLRYTSRTSYVLRRNEAMIILALKYYMGNLNVLGWFWCPFHYKKFFIIISWCCEWITSQYINDSTDKQNTNLKIKPLKKVLKFVFHNFSSCSKNILSQFIDKI